MSLTPALPQFVALGETLTDMIREAPHSERWLARSGGSGWNVARAAAALGLRSAFAGAISQDCFGDEIWRESVEAGLDMRFLQRVARPPLLAMVPESKPPQYFFLGENSADLCFDPALLPVGWSARVEWVYFGGISLARPPLAERLIDLASSLAADGLNIAYDPNYRNAMGAGYRSTFEQMCRIASIVKLSDEDLANLMPGIDTDSAFEMLRSWNPKAWWLYTEGAQGASLRTPNGHWRARPPTIELADTVGAGDAAMAGLLASLIGGGAPSTEAEHLAYAVAAGSAACMRSGAQAPSIEQITSLLPHVQHSLVLNPPSCAVLPD